MTVQESCLVRSGAAGGINEAVANDEETSGDKSRPRSLDDKHEIVASQDPSPSYDAKATAEAALAEETGPEGRSLPRRPTGHRRCLRSLVRLEEKWPRLFALAFKVLLPLLSLIVLSMFFGFGLAKLESKGEIEKNNKAIAVKDALFRAALVERIVVREGPLLCAGYYLERGNSGPGPGDAEREELEDKLLDDLDAVYARVEETDLYGGKWRDVAAVLEGMNLDRISNEAPGMVLASLDGTNVTEIDDIPGFLNFTMNCGNEIARLIKSASASYMLGLDGDGSYDMDDYSVSFNWIKCPAVNETSNATEAAPGKRPSVLLETFRYPGALTQERTVTALWANDRSNIFSANYSSYQEDPDIARLEARERALVDAFTLADGFQECIPDTNAAAWFWFTVMTTIGYGNASPSTREGRVLVWTFGFVSILVFGIVLKKAGEIVTIIFDDAVERHPRLEFLSIRWVAVLFWGALFYLWLFFVATTTVYWKGPLVEDDNMSLADAYWFAFISITTVGLGDIYFETYTISFSEVVSFALEFLVGFVLLANFLLVLGDFLQGLVRPRRAAAFRATLLQTPPLSRRTLLQTPPLSRRTLLQTPPSSGREGGRGRPRSSNATVGFRPLPPKGGH